jgi:transcription elongation factor GreA
MKQTVNYITQEKKESLEAELKELKGSKRKEILETLAHAKSLGDLSENAEYHHAREEQAKLEERIAKVEKILESAQIATASTDDTIGIGSKVVVCKEGSKEEKTFQIVGSEEVDIKQGKISNRSPFGEELFGRKKGESVTFQTPGGTVNYKIIDVL